MALKRRAGASGYIEVFILVGVAMGGAGLVLGASWAYSRSLSGPSVSVVDASIRQGAYLTVESLTVYNTGQVTSTSVSVSTTPAPGALSFCYALIDPSAMTTLASTCPPLSVGPSPLSVSYQMAPGAGLRVELTIVGAPWGVGTAPLVTVTTSAGATESVSVQVVPA